jgi:hypothetical protein
MESRLQEGSVNGVCGFKPASPHSFLDVKQIEFPRSKIWRAWSMCKDFPVSVLQLSLDVTMAMKCHIVLKMTQCFSSYRCFDKGKVTYYHATVEHNMHH